MSDIGRLFREVDSILSNFGAAPLWGAGAAAAGAPPMDISETADAFTVRADVPGLKAADVKLTLDNNTLCIAGERPEIGTDAKLSWYRAERPRGTFRRCVTLPSTIDKAKVSAHHADGTLTVTLPNHAPAAPAVTEIKIQSSL